MVIELFIKIFDSFEFNKKDLLTLLAIAIFTFVMWQNTIQVNERINNLEIQLDIMDQKMDVRYEEEVKQDNLLCREKGSAVLTSLMRSNISTTDDILEFLSQKPAGMMDLKLAVMNDDVFKELVEIYGDLARNARAAFQ